MAKESLIISGHDLTNALFFLARDDSGIYLCPRCGRFITDEMVKIGYDNHLSSSNAQGGCDRFLLERGPDSFDEWYQYALRTWGEPVNNNTTFTITPLF